jgi:hypothetical protein
MQHHHNGDRQPVEEVEYLVPVGAAVDAELVLYHGYIERVKGVRGRYNARPRASNEVVNHFSLGNGLGLVNKPNHTGPDSAGGQLVPK